MLANKTQLFLAVSMKEELEKTDAAGDMEDKNDDDAVEEDDDFEGYGEDEDVHNQEDDDYMDAIEKLKKGSMDDMAKFLIGEVSTLFGFNVFCNHKTYQYFVFEL